LASQRTPIFMRRLHRIRHGALRRARGALGRPAKKRGFGGPHRPVKASTQARHHLTSTDVLGKRAKFPHPGTVTAAGAAAVMVCTASCNSVWVDVQVQHSLY
jgi:hypothetical protein